MSAISAKERVIVALENTFETPFLTPIQPLRNRVLVRVEEVREEVLLTS